MLFLKKKKRGIHQSFVKYFYILIASVENTSFQRKKKTGSCLFLPRASLYILVVAHKLYKAFRVAAIQHSVMSNCAFQLIKLSVMI